MRIKAKQVDDLSTCLYFLMLRSIRKAQDKSEERIIGLQNYVIPAGFVTTLWDIP
jgi:hypothetical protein